MTATTPTQWRLRKMGALAALGVHGAHAIRWGLGVLCMALGVALALAVPSLARPVPADEGLWYTMQLATFSKREGAVLHYRELSHQLPESLARELRLEHIPPYYVLRVGQVKTRPEMFRLSNTVQEVHPQAMMVRAMILPERILLAQADLGQKAVQGRTEGLVTQDVGAGVVFSAAQGVSELPPQGNAQDHVVGVADSALPAPAARTATLVARTDPDITLGAPRIDTQDLFLAELGSARQELAERMRPHVGLLGTLFTDKNDISVLQGGAYGRTTVLNNLDLYAQAMTGWINQQADAGRPKSGLRRNTLELGVRQWFVTPQVMLWGGRVA